MQSTTRMFRFMNPPGQRAGEQVAHRGGSRGFAIDYRHITLERDPSRHQSSTNVSDDVAFATTTTSAGEPAYFLASMATCSRSNWLGLRDKSGAYLDGGKSYKLTVPLPVPGKLFWSVTVYDAETRSQVKTSQGKAALRSLFELQNLSGKSSLSP
jgi:hypothetical protein